MRRRQLLRRFRLRWWGEVRAERRHGARGVHAARLHPRAGHAEGRGRRWRAGRPRSGARRRRARPCGGVVRSERPPRRTDQPRPCGDVAAEHVGRCTLAGGAGAQTRRGHSALGTSRHAIRAGRAAGCRRRLPPAATRRTGDFRRRTLAWQAGASWTVPLRRAATCCWTTNWGCTRAPVARKCCRVAELPSHNRSRVVLRRRQDAGHLTHVAVFAQALRKQRDPDAEHACRPPRMPKATPSSWCCATNSPGPRRSVRSIKSWTRSARY